MLPEQRNKLREQLLEKQRLGLLGVVAAKSCVPEWVIRDWLDKPMNAPNLYEMQKLQEALDNRKRETPQASDAPANAVPCACGYLPCRCDLQDC